MLKSIENRLNSCIIECTLFTILSNLNTAGVLLVFLHLIEYFISVEVSKQSKENISIFKTYNSCKQSLMVRSDTIIFNMGGLIDTFMSG